MYTVTYQTCILETPSMKRSVQKLPFSRFSPNQAIPWTFEHLSAKDYCTRLKSEYERDVKKWMCNCCRLVLTVAGARAWHSFESDDGVGERHAATYQVTHNSNSRTRINTYERNTQVSTCQRGPRARGREAWQVVRSICIIVAVFAQGIRPYALCVLVGSVAALAIITLGWMDMLRVV